jgi:hypothetical protein
MKAALLDYHRHAGQAAEEKLPGVARGGGRRPSRQLGERDRDRQFKFVRQASESGAEHDADPRPQVGAPSHGPFQGRQSRRLVGR